MKFGIDWKCFVWLIFNIIIVYAYEIIIFITPNRIPLTGWLIDDNCYQSSL